MKTCDYINLKNLTIDVTRTDYKFKKCLIDLINKNIICFKFYVHSRFKLKNTRLVNLWNNI